MKRKLPIVAAGVAAFALLAGSAGIASAAEDDTFSPLNRDPTSSRMLPPLQPDQSITFGHPLESSVDEIMGSTYEASSVSRGPDAGSSDTVSPNITPVEDEPPYMLSGF